MLRANLCIAQSKEQPELVPLRRDDARRSLGPDRPSGLRHKAPGHHTGSIGLRLRVPGHDAGRLAESPRLPHVPALSALRQREQPVHGFFRQQRNADGGALQGDAMNTES